MWRIPHNSHQLLNSQPRSHAAAWTLTTSCSSSADFTRWRFPHSSRSLQPCIWHVGLWRLSCYLRAGMWDPCLPGASLVPPWCLPGDLRILSIAVIQLYANMSCPQVSKHATASRFFFPRDKMCLYNFVYSHKYGDCPKGVIYQYSIIPLIPYSYTNLYPKHPKATTPTAPSPHQDWSWARLAEGIQQTSPGITVDPNSVHQTAPILRHRMTRLPKNGKTGSASATSLRKFWRYGICGSRTES